MLSERIVQDLFVQICLGMAYVHRKKVLHRSAPSFRSERGFG